MANPPTSITITYLSQLPNTTSTANLPISNGSTYDQLIANIRMNGGAWFTTSAGVRTFIPYQQIVNITAQ
jgi:hypothetical protein